MIYCHKKIRYWILIELNGYRNNRIKVESLIYGIMNDSEIVRHRVGKLILALK